MTNLWKIFTSTVYLMIKHYQKTKYNGIETIKLIHAVKIDKVQYQVNDNFAF